MCCAIAKGWAPAAKQIGKVFAITYLGSQITKVCGAVTFDSTVLCPRYHCYLAVLLVSALSADKGSRSEVGLQCPCEIDVAR